jgi:hypothetical protein
MTPPQNLSATTAHQLQHSHVLQRQMLWFRYEVYMVAGGGLKHYESQARTGHQLLPVR